MTKSPHQWVYLLFLLVAVQLCIAFGDAGGDVCTDGLDCTITAIIGRDNDRNVKLTSEVRHALKYQVGGISLLSLSMFSSECTELHVSTCCRATAVAGSLHSCSSVCQCHRGRTLRPSS